MTSARSKVGPKGQAVIPKAIRESLGIRPGDEVLFTGHGGHAHVQRAEAADPEMALDDFLAAAPPRRAAAPPPARLKRDLARRHDGRLRKAGTA